LFQPGKRTRAVLALPARFQRTDMHRIALGHERGNARVFPRELSGTIERPHAV
jgi:hypothetical protein